MMMFNTCNEQSKRARVRIVVCLLVFLCNGICALQLSMVASRAPFGAFDGSSMSTRKSTPFKQPQSDLSSNFISQLAVMALKRRLKGQTHVGCDLTANSDLLLKGQVGPVTVNGRGWQSSLGLTCRAIEATVGSCQLDMGRIMSNRKLVLTTPGKDL